jgi:hypothetical protein
MCDTISRSSFVNCTQELWNTHFQNLTGLWRRVTILEISARLLELAMIVDAKSFDVELIQVG